MTIEHIILNLKRELIRTFAIADEWFDKADTLHHFRPPSGGWSVAEVLEHLTLTNHYLLILIEKGQDKALRRFSEPGNNLHEQLKDYTLAIPGLLQVGEHKSFEWHRPEHHHPQGQEPMGTLRFRMRDQLFRCLYALECLPNGEGILHQTTMTVNGLGKLDVYQYLYFLSLHARRHLTQMDKLQNEFMGADVPQENGGRC
jgi:hypothetical protein